MAKNFLLCRMINYCWMSFLTPPMIFTGFKPRNFGLKTKSFNKNKTILIFFLIWTGFSFFSQSYLCFYTALQWVCLQHFRASSLVTFNRSHSANISLVNHFLQAQLADWLNTTHPFYQYQQNKRHILVNISTRQGSMYNHL